MSTQMQIINLADEWRRARFRQLREAKFWLGLFCWGVAGTLLTMGLLILKIPQSLQEQRLWEKRAAQAAAESQEPQPLPMDPSRLLLSRAHCTEFSLGLMAVTRLLPREVWLHELQISLNQQTGITINLRGGALGFEAVRLYTDRLRQAGLFGDVTPVSVNRNDPNLEEKMIRYEIRLSMPVSSMDHSPETSSKEGPGT